MNTQRILANASQVMVEQLVASGVRYVFNNPGSREALFFDALASNPRIHGVMALHEGSVAAMAGGYAQANLDPAVMSVHLGAGLAQSLGQLINVWSGMDLFIMRTLVCGPRLVTGFQFYSLYRITRPMALLLEPLSALEVS